MKQLSRILILVLFLITSLGVTSGLASPGDDDPPSYPLFIPLVSNKGLDDISISGTVLDADSHPIRNVTIRDNYGSSAITDEEGEYTLYTQKGENLLTAQNPGFTFEPEQRTLDANGDLSGQDFSGVTACGDIMVNGKVTAGEGGWDFPVKDKWDYATARTDAFIFRSAPTSGMTGIPPWPNPDGPDNIDVHSNAISRKYYIPSDANHVLLSMHLYRQSTNLSDDDRQYVKILDANNNTLKVLWNGLRNDANWDAWYEWELNAYAGMTIKVEVGTENDGKDGVARMYFDDVQLLICKQETPDEGCNKVINSDFEDGTIGWTIPAQDHPPVISNVHAKSGANSMKTGNTSEESYSEFYQDVQIPSDADSATLKFHVYTRSQAPSGSAPESNTQDPAATAGESWNRPAVPATDTNYAYVKNTSGQDLKKLMWWENSSTNSWTYLEFDLSAFKGKTVRLEFGTYNDGKGNESTMWVDTVYLDACGGGAPPPPSGCYEALANTGFENNTAWIIPATEYTAGYSTSQFHSGARSMRSGIYIPTHNTYSYSDFRQKLTIPSKATSADLKTWIWPKSTEPDAVPRAALLNPQLLEPQNVDGRLYMSPEAGDAQYILVLNAYGSWIDTLWWKSNPTRDDRTWISHTHNLMAYKGKTIYLQFGVFNNGGDGATSMFVDDTTVEICIP